MNTLHIDTGLEMRGGQWQALYLMRGLAAAGHGVRLLAPPGSPLFAAAQSQGTDAQPLGWKALLANLRRPGIVHAHDARAHTLALAGAKGLVVSRRVAFPPGRNFASRWKYRRAARYIAVSHCVREALVSAGVCGSKIAVVYDGVPAAPEPPNSPARTLVLALDSDDPKKGRKKLEQAAALARVPVYFSKDLTRDLPRAAVFVYITESEGLGSAALLAMASGAAVVASRVGGLPEIVEDGVTGILTANEPAAIASSLRRVLEDPELTRRMAAEARLTVNRRFPVERMVAETMDVYKTVLR